MLSGEGNAADRCKTTMGPISKKSNYARAAIFFCTFSLPLNCTTTT